MTCSRGWSGGMAMYVKQGILIALMGVAAIASARAQTQIRIGDEEEAPPAAASPAKPASAPKPPSLFIVNENVVGYYYAPTATNPGAGKTPKNVGVVTHFDVWAYGTNYVQVEFLKAANSANPPF